MDTVNFVSANSLEELYRRTMDKCKDVVQENLLLTGLFSIKELESDFVKLNWEIAKKWQNINKPIELLINHGCYLNKKNRTDSASGILFIIEELKRKRSGNRACLSLINMLDIVDSGDEAIPSFLVSQFSFSVSDPNELLVTIYFRALEVQNFLPINIAEMCINIKEITKAFTDVDKFRLHFFAFRAQIIPKFNCLRNAQIDIIDSMELMLLINDKKYQDILKMLYEKLDVEESIIITKGLESLSKGLSLRGFIKMAEKVDSVMEIMLQIKQIRRGTSIYTEQLKIKYTEFRSMLEEVIVMVEEEWGQ